MYVVCRMSEASKSLWKGLAVTPMTDTRRMHIDQELARIVARRKERKHKKTLLLQELARKEQSRAGAVGEMHKKRRVDIEQQSHANTPESKETVCSECVVQTCQVHCPTCQNGNASTCESHGEVQGLHEARILAGLISPSTRTSPGVSKSRSRVYKQHAPLKEYPFSDAPCCAKKPPCCEYYDTHDIQAFRESCLLPDEPRVASAARCRAHKAQSRMQGGKQYCNKFMEYWSGISGGSFRQGISQRGRDNRYNKETRLRKDSCIIAWFNILKESIEMQPDKHEFHLAAVHKADVYKWYLSDSEEYPTFFPEVDRTYFNKIWREQCCEVKLRRVLRFTKCLVCDRLRDTRRNTKLSRAERDAANDKLDNHYRLVKRERYVYQC